MLKKIFVAGVFLLFGVMVNAQNMHRHNSFSRGPSPRLAYLDDLFARKTMKFKNFELNYRERAYNLENATSRPCVVMCLHGGSGRYDDYYVCRGAVKGFDDYFSTSSIPAIVIAPQCEGDNSWEDLVEELCGLIDDVVARYNANPERIYLCGVSMGAQGGWYILSHKTDSFAAAQLLSAAPKRYIAENVAKTPIYFTLGDDDIDWWKDYEPDVKRIRSLGGEIVFKVLPDMNHGRACNMAVTPESIEFLLSHSRSRTKN